MKRRSDVDRVILDSVGGTFVLTAKKGKSLDYKEVADLLGKKQKAQWVELTVVGEVTRDQDQLSLKASGTAQKFLLAPEPPSKQAEANKKASPFEKLEAAVKAKKAITAVTGKVQEPKSEKGKPKSPATLLVTAFETAGE